MKFLYNDFGQHFYKTVSPTHIHTHWLNGDLTKMCILYVYFISIDFYILKFKIRQVYQQAVKSTEIMKSIYACYRDTVF